MNDNTNFRRERIEKLLFELRYEIERGMIEGDIEETLNFRFIVPISKCISGDIVLCEFHTKPTHRYMLAGDMQPKLRVVK